MVKSFFFLLANALLMRIVFLTSPTPRAHSDVCYADQLGLADFCALRRELLRPRRGHAVRPWSAPPRGLALLVGWS